MVISGNLGDRGVDRLIMSNGFGRLSQANARATCVATIVEVVVIGLRFVLYYQVRAWVYFD